VEHPQRQTAEAATPLETGDEASETIWPTHLEPARYESRVITTPADGPLLWLRDMAVAVIVLLTVFVLLAYFIGALAAIIAIACFIGLLAAVAYSAVNEPSNWKL
jgi:hypothetical protein